MDPDPDAEPDPAIFVRGIKEGIKTKIFNVFLLFTGTI
jgi:hypothetical protein